MRFSGRIFFVTEDQTLIRRQLDGENLPWDPARPLALRDAISTDELTPAWTCFHYDEKLGDYCLTGLRGDVVKPGDVRKAGFEVIVSGTSKGCGSSRETAPFSEKVCGIRLVIAKSIEKIYGQNAINIGLLTSTDFGLIPRIAAGEDIPLEELTAGLDPISRAIAACGGLFALSKARQAGRVSIAVAAHAPRPMTMVEKIVARHAVVDPQTGRLGVDAVAPGDSLFVRTDVRFTHEYVTPMADALLRGALGPDARIEDPDSVYAFRDHLTFLARVMPEAKKKQGLLDLAEGLATTQRAVTERQGIRLYAESPKGGAEAICHNAVVEDIALPGQIVTGTDSHTCMAGVLGCFAFGVGATDMANAWVSKEIRVRVPETVRFTLRGRLGRAVAAKDVMLHILAQDFWRGGGGIGKVLEFTGDGVYALPMDERATLTNMAVEAGGFTGIIAPDDVCVQRLARSRGLSAEIIRAGVVTSDPDARYAYDFAIDLAAVPPMVATPGDPRNGVPLGRMPEGVRVDIAYGGSCTGGKQADMDMYAAILGRALADGRRVAPGVRLYLQFGSQKIRDYAVARGYPAIFERAGAEILGPSCGACINAGPGASSDPHQVTVSSQNRNFNGRSGPGKVYLASPYTVAAAAITGFIGPHTLDGFDDIAAVPLPMGSAGHAEPIR